VKKQDPKKRKRKETQNESPEYEKKSISNPKYFQKEKKEKKKTEPNCPAPSYERHSQIF
jgi:hypothetical protein